ncbi:hypothetical protein TRIUR3_21813 [Triticum urartu]|uniref:Uncharacterized protein n=1 Tax=Triticum urartu TaxID=4572 RepID=M7Z1U2_TRIUA|nr:hypothetical protein TRIUR3_21813 [Triticum urartu]
MVTDGDHDGGGYLDDGGQFLFSFNYDIPKCASASYQALPVQGQPGPSHHYPDVARMGGGSGQTNAPCGDIYARECVVAGHHNNNLCCVDFRFFGDELDYIPLKATYPAHERGYLKTILGD